MDVILTDPLGRAIALTDGTWHGHIVKGHPDLAGHRDRVEQAVREPLQINVSKADSQCRLYFGRGRGDLLVAVVANVAAGFVKTAYSCRSPGSGVREWP